MTRVTAKPKLRAFVVEHADEPDRGKELAYAYTPQQARQLACDHLDAEYVEVRATRAREYDARAAEHRVPCVEGGAYYLRKVGWRVEDEIQCGTCGMAAMGLDEYAVCEASCRCRACGCPAECKHEQGFSCG